jgi:hypothetical protein
MLPRPLPLKPITDFSFKPAWLGGAVYLRCNTSNSQLSQTENDPKKQTWARSCFFSIALKCCFTEGTSCSLLDLFDSKDVERAGRWSFPFVCNRDFSSYAQNGQFKVPLVLRAQTAHSESLCSSASLWRSGPPTFQRCRRLHRQIRARGMLALALVVPPLVLPKTTKTDSVELDSYTAWVPQLYKIQIDPSILKHSTTG